MTMNYTVKNCAMCPMLLFDYERDNSCSHPNGTDVVQSELNNSCDPHHPTPCPSNCPLREESITIEFK